MYVRTIVWTINGGGVEDISHGDLVRLHVSPAGAPPTRGDIEPGLAAVQALEVAAVPTHYTYGFIHKYVYMYVFMYYVNMMLVCVYVCMQKWSLLYVCTYVCMNTIYCVCTYVCIDVIMYVCMYV